MLANLYIPLNDMKLAVQKHLWGSYRKISCRQVSGLAGKITSGAVKHLL